MAPRTSTRHNLADSINAVQFGDVPLKGRNPPEDLMTRHFRAFSGAMAASVLCAAVANAQTFKVQKYNIGGEGGTDYVTAEPGTGRVFVSRATHIMVVEGATGKVLGDIPDTPRVHGVGIAAKHNRGFTTNGGDSTVTMFDLKTLAVI